MRKYLGALLATMLCVCCLGLVACGDSGSSSSASSSAAPESSAATESSSAAESSSVAADPSEKFIGDWTMAGMEANGVTIVGDLSAMDVGTASLSISADGTGTVTLEDDKATFTWKQTDENTLSITVDNTDEETAISSVANAVYQDDTVRINIEAEDQTGTIIFSKDGSVPGMEPLPVEKATDITSEDVLPGTWKASAITLEGATMYGDSASLAAVNGSEELVITFEAGGKVTLFGEEATWIVDEKGATISDPNAEVSVKALGDDIIVNVGETYGMNMYIRFSK